MGAAVPGEVVTGTLCAGRLQQVFDHCFRDSHRTRLVGGAAEPLYAPATDAAGHHLIHFREDYFASALHEVAHWCIAGDARRQLTDFGYWYAPDGRSPAQQKAFEDVEFKPQALEWFFARACGYRFRISVDNLDLHGGELPDTAGFRQRVVEQARHWQKHGLPIRAQRFYDALCVEFATDLAASQQPFSLMSPNDE